jgi:hypothetical protein
MIARESMSDGLAAHLAVSLGIDSGSAEEMEGVRTIAEAALDYFSSSVRGAPSGSGPALLWAVYSGLLHGRVPQERIDGFFGSARIDIPWLIQNTDVSAGVQVAVIPDFVRIDGLAAALAGLDPSEAAAGVSVVAVPGNLQDADIADIAVAIARARDLASQQKSTRKKSPP